MLYEKNSVVRGTTALVVMVLTALATAACQTSARDLHYKADTRFDTQQQAGSAHVAVISVGSWEDYQGTLQPNFSMDESKALASVVPSTQLLREETQQALSLLLKLRSADVKLTEEKSKTRITDPENVGGNKDEEVEKSGSKTETTDAGALGAPKGATLGAPGSLPSKKDILEQPIDIDPFMRHAAAAALFQEVRLLNRYIRDAAMREGYRALVVRVQVNLMPAARNEPYDAYTTLSFFPPRGGSSGPVLFANWGQTGSAFHGLATDGSPLSRLLQAQDSQVGEVQKAISGEKLWLTGRSASDELWQVEGWEEVLRMWEVKLSELQDKAKGLEEKKIANWELDTDAASYASMVASIRDKLTEPFGEDTHPLEASIDRWIDAGKRLDDAALALSTVDEAFARKLLQVGGRLRDVLLEESKNARRRATVIASAHDTLWLDAAKGPVKEVGIDGAVYAIVREFIAADKDRLPARKRAFANAAEGRFVIEACHRLESQLAGLSTDQLKTLSGKENKIDATVWLNSALLQIRRTIELIEEFHPKPQANAPIVVPLLVTDGMERSFGSRTTLVMQQYSLALSAMLKYFSAAGESTYQLQDLLATVGNDYNSLFSVARISENSIQVRIGAMLQSTAQFTMVPQNRYVTMLLLVPKEVETGEKVNMLSRTSFVDCKTGEQLPVGEEPPTLWWKPRFASLFAPRFKVSLRATALANDFPRFVSEFTAALAELRERYQKNDDTLYGWELKDLEPDSRVPAEAYVEQLWSQIVNQLGRSPYASTQLQVPPLGRGPELPKIGDNERLPAFDDGATSCVVSLTDAPQIPADAVYAEFRVTWPDFKLGSVDVPHGSGSVALTSLASRAGGKVWTLRFPSMKRTKVGAHTLHDIIVGAADRARVELWIYGEDIATPSSYKLRYTYAEPATSQSAVDALPNALAILLESGQSNTVVTLDFPSALSDVSVSLRFEDNGLATTGFIDGAKVSNSATATVVGQTVSIGSVPERAKVTLELKALQAGTVVKIVISAKDRRSAEFQLQVHQKPNQTPENKK
ncbi:MAG: hypothetical protein IT461_16490 [Planctomycetes bacterium]|nr:hypothetical protein [Planctomycetota bacterium]